MASTAVVFDILAKDSASAKFDHLGNVVDGSSSKMSKFTGIMASAGKAAAYGLGAGLVLASAAAVDFAKRAAEDEQGAKLMATAFKNNAAATDQQIGATERWITAQGQAFGVADDDLRPALSRLVTSTHDVGAAQKLAALAMDVSAGSGKSLESVSTALMKAQNGQVSALSRLGINTKDAAGATITMEQATARMADTFSGAAAAKAGTLQGKMDRLKVIFNETKETIGAKLIPIVSDFADVLINKVVPNIAPVASKLGEIAKLGWDKLQDGVGNLRDLYNSAQPFIELGWEKVKDAVGYLGDLGQRAKDALTPLTDLSNFDAATFGQNLGSAVAKGLDALVSLAGTVTTKLAALFAKVDWVGLGIGFGKQVPALLTGLAVGILAFDPMPILIGLKDHWGDVLLAVLAIAFAPAKIAGGLGKILAKIPFVGKFMEHAVLWLNELGGKFTEAVSGFFSRVWAQVVERLDFPGVGVIAKIIAGMKSFPTRLKSFFDDLGAWIELYAEEAFGKMEKGIAKPIAAVLNFLGKLPGRMLSALGNLGSLLVNAGSSLIQGLINSDTSRIAEVEGLLRSLASKAADAFKAALGIHSPSLVFTEAGVNIVEGIVAGIDKGKVKLDTVLGKLTDFISKHQEKLSKLRDKRQGIIDSFKGMTSSVFGMDMGANEDGRPKTVNDLLGFQKAQRDKAERLKGDVANLTQKGLSSDLIHQLMNSGEAGQEQIHLLASATEDQIAQLNADNLATQQALQAAGIEASKALGIEQAIKQEERDIKLAQGIKQALKELLDEQDKNTVVELHLDGHRILWSLKKIKRENGGHLGLGDSDNT